MEKQRYEVKEWIKEDANSFEITVVRRKKL